MTLQQVSSFTPIDGNDKINEIKTGLDFILSHFLEEDSIFPRKTSTYKSENKQFLVRSKEEIIESFTDSNFVNCRINAYPSLTEYKGISRYKPDLLFIDLDKNNNFKSETAFKLTLTNTLKKIKDKLDSQAFPTVLWSGNGYHIIQPVCCPTALENFPEFEKFDRPSEQFLRFCKDFLSSGKADKSNYPSFRSCLLRIPETINSKNNKRVTIVQKWNGYRPRLPIDLIDEFLSYLIQKKIDEDNRRRHQKILQARRSKNGNNNNYYYYDWIETKILTNPFSDYRKLAVGLILAPYLIVIKKLTYDQSYKIIYEWLMKCNTVRKLDFDPKYLINNNIKTSTKKLIPPISIYKLETNYPNLYFLIEQKKRKKEKEE
jgi:hypothetical protein